MLWFIMEYIAMVLRLIRWIDGWSIIFDKWSSIYQYSEESQFKTYKEYGLVYCIAASSISLFPNSLSCMHLFESKSIAFRGTNFKPDYSSEYKFRGTNFKLSNYRELQQKSWATSQAKPLVVLDLHLASSVDEHCDICGNMHLHWSMLDWGYCFLRPGLQFSHCLIQLNEFTLNWVLDGPKTQ